MQMPLSVLSWEQKSLWLGRVILLQPNSEIFNDGDGSRCQLAFGVALADHHLRAHSAPAIVNISRLQGKAIIDAAAMYRHRANSVRSLRGERVNPAAKRR